MAKGPVIPVSTTHIEKHLEDQLGFLRKSIRDYDDGDLSEFKRMAVALRVLLHDQGQSRSILTQLALEVKFQSFAMKLNPNNQISDFSLAIIEHRGDGARLLPALDQTPVTAKLMLFEDWWNEPVLRDNHRHEFTRRSIVLEVADTDGGAHADPALAEAYHRLKNEQSIGVVIVGPDGTKPIEHIEKVYLRHIAREALESINAAWSKVLGNRKCACGSGRKYRYCGAVDRCV